MTHDEDVKDTIEDSPEEVAVESEKSAEQQPPEGFVRRYWMVSLGVLLAVIGLAGMLALRLNYAQVYIFGDSYPYTGIGTAEPLGHFVSLVPFVFGIIFVIVWGLKTKPFPDRTNRSGAPE